MWNKGDMCFFEFKLSRIEETNQNGEPTEITDGHMRTSTGGSFVGGCFPVTIDNKLISEAYERASDKIHREGLQGLNYPDIHRWLVTHWAGTCQLKPKGKYDYERRYKGLDDFVEEVLEPGRKLHDVLTKSGIWLMRR